MIYLGFGFSYRFGSFEIFKPVDPVSGRGGPSPNKKEILFQMLDYVLEHFYSHIHSNTEWSSEDKYLKMYDEVSNKAAYHFNIVFSLHRRYISLSVSHIT